MNLVILRTNIESENGVRIMRPVFDNHDAIHKWSIDLEDVDNVLRIETKKSIAETEIIQLIEASGFYGVELED